MSIAPKTGAVLEAPDLKRERRVRRGPRLLDRSTGEIVIMGMAATVFFLLIASSLTVMVIELIDPATDTSSAAVLLSDTMNTLIGVMAGFLAGRTEAGQREPVE